MKLKLLVPFTFLSSLLCAAETSDHRMSSCHFDADATEFVAIYAMDHAKLCDSAKDKTTVELTQTIERDRVLRQEISSLPSALPKPTWGSKFRIVEEKYMDFPDGEEGCSSGYECEWSLYHFYDKNSGAYLGQLYEDPKGKSQEEILRDLEESKTCICCCMTLNFSYDDPHL